MWRCLSAQRRVFFVVALCLLGITVNCANNGVGEAPAGGDAKRGPNILLIMTDDQGFGDLGAHGNTMIRTPNLDRFYSESARLTQFHVSPVCAPTRASLMTGRYNYRTGVVDTWVGRAIMESSEVTIAELLGQSGYRTGIFGKWHLGDTYPYRPIDQGFQESLVHKGGGIGQPSDPANNTYFDSRLLHNGEWVVKEGYCTDTFADAALRFIEQDSDKPFFVYLPTNAPHTPLQVDESLVGPYREMELHDDPGIPDEKRNFDAESTARVYGMVENIDQNVGRLLTRIDELGIRDNTIVIFMTDNGPQQHRFNGGMRGRKTMVWEGGIRVPFLIRWPERIQGGRDIDRIAAHIDVMPTLLDACGIDLPADLKVDGVSLLSLLEGASGDWPDRTLFFQTHRGDAPILYCNFAARTQQYKIVQPISFEGQNPGQNPHIGLYDMSVDPSESNDLSKEKPEILAELKGAYENWFKDVSSSRGYHPVRIHLGTAHQNPVELTPQDWRGSDSYGVNSVGYYEVTFAEAGEYRFRLEFLSVTKPAEIFLKIGDQVIRKKIGGFKNVGSDYMVWTPETVRVEGGDTRIEAWVQLSEKEKVGVRYVRVEKL